MTLYKTKPIIICEFNFEQIVQQPNVFQQKLLSLYKEWQGDNAGSYHCPVYQMVILYKNIIDPKHYNNFKVVIYNTLDAEVVPSGTTPTLHHSETLAARSFLVRDYINTKQLNHNYHDIYRLIFSLTKPNPIQARLIREGCQLRLYYTHHKFFDIFAHYQDVMKTFDTLTYKAQDTLLYNESGLINVLLGPTSKELADSLIFDCHQQGDMTVILFEHPTIGENWNDGTIKFNLPTANSIHLIDDELDEFLAMDTFEMQELIRILIFECLYNFMMHDGADTHVQINTYQVEDKVYTLINHTFKSNNNQVEHF